MRTHVDLFSGLGGFALAALGNGVRTIQFCEYDARCREFLARAWPGVPCHPDVREFHWGVADAGREERGVQPGGPEGSARLARSEPAPRDQAGVWLLTAGVPCQPASRAGKQRGAEDDRWLWPEAVRVLSEVRPTWALFENPPGIGDVGLSGVLAEVEAVGYEVRVFGVPACAVGAPHRRERYWIVCRNLADAEVKRVNRGDRGDRGEESAGNKGQPEPFGISHLADTQVRGQRADGGSPRRAGHADQCDAGGVGDTECVGGGRGREPGRRETGAHDGDRRSMSWGNYVWLPCADGKVRRAPDGSQRMAHGLPVELLEGLGAEARPEDAEGLTPHRSLLGALGNSIVWQVAQVIIAAMIEAEATEDAP